MVRLNKRQLEVATRRRDRFKRLAEEFESLSAEGRLAYIPANAQPTEFEIQSFLFEQLKLLGFEVRGEVQSRCGTCIFDLVIFKESVPVRIIEVKKRHREFVRSKRKLQVVRYQSFGIPVDLVCTLRSARDYIEAIKADRERIQ